MSDIFATLAAGTPRPTTAAGGEAAVRVIDPSPDLARLASGENLRGTVVGKDDHGHLLVQTRLGVLTLAATRNLPVGSEVVLQVRSVGPQVLLNLLPLDNAGAAAPQSPVQSPVQSGQPAQAPLPPGSTPAQPSLPPNPHDLVQRSQLLRGVLHAAPPMPALAGLPTAQPGTELIVRILSLGVQAQITGAAVQTPSGAQSSGVLGGAVLSGGVPTGGTPAAGGPPSAILPGAPVPGAPAAGSPAQNGAASVPGGTTASGTPSPGVVPAGPGGEAAPGLRLAPQIPVTNSGHSVATALQGLSAEAAARAAGSPGQPAAAAGSLPGALPAAGGAAPAGTPAGPGSLRITGLVTAATSSGQPILHTPLGTITLNIPGSDARAGLPPGTSLALEIGLPAAGRPASTPALAPAWPGLEGLQDTLLHGLPAGQAEQVARALPQVGPRLASGVLFLLSALTQGNVAGWLAKAGLAGEAGERGDLHERLGRELTGLTRGVETTSGDWRFVNLPLWSEQGLRELRCFFRHHSHGGKGEDGDKATRFVLELELQHHGELQLDGLVRARQFDLVLRSRRAFPALVRGDLLALFEEANAIAGYSGRLSFQSSADWLQLLAARGANPQPHEGIRV
ncbi:hypothetical protein [Pelagibius sp. 7325]|uniref:hypothetical protein n=1 Tax=Pelagibius sp. 7325 TaxID=3131994 RepID=UPI0030EB5C3E